MHHPDFPFVGRYTIKPQGRKDIYDRSELRSLILEGKADQEIADITGCSKTNVAYHRRNMGITYRRGSGGTPRLDYSQIEELYSQRKNDNEISEEMGCSQAAIWNWRTKRDLPRVRTRRVR